MSNDKASSWQERITGEWFGAPSVFDADGIHQGYEDVERASVFEDGRTTYWMKTRLIDGGHLRPRFELTDQFDFSVEDSDSHRLYLGPDFYGAGEPFGSMVDAHYYSPAWKADLRTLVHILPDGETQVYSSLLYDGPTLAAVFNGVYTVAFDHADNRQTQERIEEFRVLERARGPRPQVLPHKKVGRWTGTLEVFDQDQKPLGDAHVTIDHQPIDLLSYRQTTTVTGAIDRTWTVERRRENQLTTFHGPDAWGNGRTFGRALYPSIHFTNDSMWLEGREFLINDELDLSVVWFMNEGRVLRSAAFGLLTFQADA